MRREELAAFDAQILDMAARLSRAERELLDAKSEQAARGAEAADARARAESKAR